MTTDNMQRRQDEEKSSGILRLRLNLKSGTSASLAEERTEPRIVRIKSPQKSPAKTSRLGLMDSETWKEVPPTSHLAGHGGLVQANSNENDVSVTTAAQELRPIKLTVRLKPSPASSLSTLEFAKPDKELPVGKKIVLQVKKPTERTDKLERVDIETIDKPKKTGKRSSTVPRVKQVKSLESNEAGDKLTRGKRPSLPLKDKPIMATALSHPFSTIPAISKGPTAPSLPMSAMRPANMTRVPIAALSSLTSMTPVEREEERMLRQCLAETLNTLWPMVTKPRLAESCNTWKAVSDRVLPYWLMLAPIDSALNHHPTPKTIGVIETDMAAEKLARINDELCKLQSRFALSCMNERNKEISTELLVLEQRLCLEEEKFLYAKLKSEYNKKVSELIQRKRQTEGGQVSGGTSTGISTPISTQRILPKVSSWASGSGIQILRGSTGASDST